MLGEPLHKLSKARIIIGDPQVLRFLLRFHRGVLNEAQIQRVFGDINTDEEAERVRAEGGLAEGGHNARATSEQDARWMNVGDMPLALLC